MRPLYPLMLDAGQPAGEVLALLQDPDLPRAADDVVLVRLRERLRVRWFVTSVAPLLHRLAACAPTIALADAMSGAERYDDARRVQWDEATRDELDPESPYMGRGIPGWVVVFARSRFVALRPPMPMAGPPSAPPRTEPPHAIPAAAPIVPHAPAAAPAPAPASATAPGRRTTRSIHRSKPATAADGPTPSGADPADAMGHATPSSSGTTGATDTLLAVARVDAPRSVTPSPTAHATMTIGLAPAPSPQADGVMRFESDVTDTTMEITVLVEAPDFTCATGWKHALTVHKADPFSAAVTLELVPVAPEDRTPRIATVRVHYSYRGQPAGMAVRTIALGDVTAAEAATLPAPATATLTIEPTAAPVDLTIRIARRDGSDTARELLWSIVDCAVPAVALPDAPLLQKVGDRDNASSFASKVTSQVNGADGTPTVDNMLCSIGTLIRRAIPADVLTVLSALHAAITDRLPRVLLLTDECHVPWELAYLDTPPDASRAPFLGAQFAVSRWIHGEDDIPIPPPATLAVRDLAIVLGSYEQSSMAPLPHAKDETTALTAEATQAPTRFPRVTSVDATADALVDLLNGALPVTTGKLAPELVHFACHGEVLGSGIAKRSVLYLNDGTQLQETLFVSSKLGRTAKSFLFMNACQVGVGGEELGQYAGFAGFAIGAGFSGFIGPLWSVNDEVAKRIAVAFYRRCFGTDGAPSRPVADVLADMRSQYLSEPDPKKRQSTWLAYVHYGHPHFTLTHAQ